MRGLKWCDLGFENLWFDLKRVLVGRFESDIKTEGSKKGLPKLPERLLYQQPEIPTVDEVAKIAKERQELEVKMQAEFDGTLLLNWSGFTSHRVTAHQSTETPAPPTRD